MRLAVILFLTGCGSTDCDLEDRHGSYLLTFEEVSGDCGTVPDQIVNLSNDPSDGCEVSNKTVSDDQCSIESRVVCVGNTGVVTSSQITTTQESDNGDLISGMMTAEISEANGDYICLGTYSLEYRRQ